MPPLPFSRLKRSVDHEFGRCSEHCDALGVPRPPSSFLLWVRVALRSAHLARSLPQSFAKATRQQAALVKHRAGLCGSVPTAEFICKRRTLLSGPKHRPRSVLVGGALPTHEVRRPGGLSERRHWHLLGAANSTRLQLQVRLHLQKAQSRSATNHQISSSVLLKPGSLGSHFLLSLPSILIARST